MVVTSRLSASLIFAAAATALIGALIAEYGFGLRPCELCLAQRAPYALILVLSTVALLPGLSERRRVLFLGLCSLAFLVDGGLAVYHVGVEQHWWGGPAACTGGAPMAASLEQLQAMLAAPLTVVRCDEVAWSLFGISMAGYNIVYATGCAILAAGAIIRLRRVQ